MGQVIVIKNPDGGVFVVRPTGEVPIETVLIKDVPNDPSLFKVMDQSALPVDRNYMGAWVLSGEAVSVDLEKAKVIHQGGLIAALLMNLKKIEQDILEAEIMGKPIDVAALEAKRTKLKSDVKLIDVSKANTLEELKAMWPSDLEKKVRLK